MNSGNIQTASQAAIPRSPTVAEIQQSIASGRSHQLDISNTIFSPDRRHRFTLYRHLGDESRLCCFVGTNPSGADQIRADRTVVRCREFAKRWGFGGFYMLNAHSLRATDPAELYGGGPSNLPANDSYILWVVQRAERVVVAWGMDGASLGRSKAVERILLANCTAGAVWCFGKNKDGTPTHPLYQPYDKPLIPYFSAPNSSLTHQAEGVQKGLVPD